MGSFRGRLDVAKITEGRRLDQKKRLKGGRGRVLDLPQTKRRRFFEFFHLEGMVHRYEKKIIRSGGGKGGRWGHGDRG